MITIEEQIISTLEKIRPILQREGGDVEFVKYQDGIVYVKMIGACSDCAYQDETISTGVEMILVDEVPGVVKVTAVRQ